MLKYCTGCRDDFYNGNNQYGIKECWNLKDSKVKTRYRISINAPMGNKENYQKVKTNSCYHEQGYVYLNEIPDYAR